MAKTLATRMAFGQEIIEIAKTNENFVVCNADTKTCGLEKFGKYFPEREFSFGIAEQNLVAASGRHGRLWQQGVPGHLRGVRLHAGPASRCVPSSATPT